MKFAPQTPRQWTRVPNSGRWHCWLRVSSHRGGLDFTTSYPSVPERITVVPSYVLVSYNYSVLTVPRSRLLCSDHGSPHSVPVAAVEQSALCSRRVATHPLSLGCWTVCSTPREHEAGVHQSSGAQAALLIGARTPNHHHHAHIPPTATSAMPLSVCLSIYLSTDIPTYTATPSPHNPLRVNLLRIDLIRGRCGHQSWMARQSGSTP